MILIQLFLYCLILTLMVRISTLGGAVNAIFFYPEEYQKIAFSRGIADPADVAAKRKRFMIPFVIVMFITLLLIVGVWDRASDFKSAYVLSLLFLEVMSWYDGIFIDRVWVGHSKFWVISGMEDQSYVPSWWAVKVKRGTLTLVWVAVAVIPAAIICLCNFICG